MNILENSTKSLEELDLSENNIDEDFLKKITIPQRLGYLDFISLTKINLSKNYGVKPFKFLKYFSKFSKLNQISISVFKDDLKIHELNKDYLEYGYIICKCKSQGSISIDNIGWISALNINNLISNKNIESIDLAQGRFLFFLNIFF